MDRPSSSLPPAREGISKIVSLVESHDERCKTTINLVGSENVLSPAARRALNSDLCQRYLIPPAGMRPPEIWDYPNQDFSREIEAIAATYACELFGGEYADLRALSGNNVAGIVLAGLAERGDQVLSVPGSAGGHFATVVLGDRFGLEMIGLPYDMSTGRICLEKCAEIARSVLPRLIYLDASMILFPYPVAQLREIFGKDCAIVYDASHTFGVIAGKQFQAPLAEGADMIVGSTHKSMFGPQKGLIVARERGRVADAIHDVITPTFVSNAHVHHVAALGVALEECLEFGEDYARRVVENSRCIARSLHDRGLDMLFPEQDFTDCHLSICILDRPALPILEALQRAGIHVNAINAPFAQKPGLRLGSAEITRRGFEKEAVEEIADCMADVILGRVDESKVAERVSELSLAHSGIRYGFDYPSEVYS